MVQMHTIQVGHEWAHIVTDEDTGLFVAHGSYGTFANCWPPRGRSGTLHEFLARLGFDYFMNKARPDDFQRFNFDATMKAVREDILRSRRAGDITKQQAADAWYDLDMMDETTSLDAFTAALSSDVTDALGEAWWECIQRGPSPECTEFWRVIWPAFLAKVQPSLSPATHEQEE